MCLCLFRTSSYIEERRAREKVGESDGYLRCSIKERKNWYFFASLTGVPIPLRCQQVQFPVYCAIQFDEVVVEKEEKELVFFYFSCQHTDTTRVQTSAIPCVLYNLVRRRGSRQRRERRQRTGIFFTSLASVPIQLGCKQVQFPMCCAIQFDEVVVEKEEKELRFFLVLLSAYRNNSGANKYNSLCAAQFNSTRGYSRKKRKNWYFFLLLLPAYRYNSGANKYNSLCAAQFSSTGW